MPSKSELQRKKESLLFSAVHNLCGQISTFLKHDTKILRYTKTDSTKTISINWSTGLVGSVPASLLRFL